MIARTAITGTMIGPKEHRGKGYGSEAKMLFLHFAFNILGLRTLISKVIEFNTASIEYSKACGYQLDTPTPLRGRLFRKGKVWSEYQMSVSKDEWLAARQVYCDKHGITWPY